MGLESILVIYAALSILPYALCSQFLINWMSFTTFCSWITVLLYCNLNYTLCVFQDPGKIYEESSLIKKVEKHYCRQCELYTKPERAHHCRRCKICIKRMDHHCVWIDACVGFHNQGHFVRFILSAWFICFYTICLLCMYSYDTLTDPGNVIFNSVFQIFLFSFSSVCLIPTTTILTFLSFNQLLLLLRNRTTIEDLEIREEIEMGLPEKLNLYDKGFVKNISEILGNNVLLWWMPQRMTGDGIKFRDSSEYDSL